MAGADILEQKSHAAPPAVFAYGAREAQIHLLKWCASGMAGRYYGGEKQKPRRGKRSFPYIEFGSWARMLQIAGSI